jgi:hypothetical protein
LEPVPVNRLRGAYPLISCAASWRTNTEQAQNGAPIYEAIKESIRQSPYMNADGTGWRVDGGNHWLWVFTNKDVAFYQIDKSRGGKVVSDILGEKYPGALISDFYSAYNKLQALAKQRCLGHLLAEIKKVQKKNKLAPESIDGMFCQELKTELKQTIDVWNEYHEGTKVFEDLVKEKQRPSQGWWNYYYYRLSIKMRCVSISE